MDNSEFGGNRDSFSGEQSAGNVYDFDVAFSGEKAPEQEVNIEAVVEEITPTAEKKERNISAETGRSLGKASLSLMGDKLDEVGISAEVKKIKELPTLYEQSAARDEIVAQFMPQNGEGKAA
jgi:hypothetical protein